jgi:hypothetical protein
MLSLNPSLTAQQVDTILKVTADDFGPAGWDPGYGWGRLNTGRAIDTVQAMLNGAADTNPPAIGFAQPQIGGDINGVAGISNGELVRLNVLDDRGVNDVSLFADGLPVGTDVAAPYNFSWNTSMFGDGSQHTLTAVATDNSGNTTTVSTAITLRAGFDATPPQVAFVSPTNDGRIHGNVAISINATDNSSITRVEFYSDNQLITSWSAGPYTMRWATNKLSKGTHTLMCAAYDAAGNSTSASIIVVK